MKYLLDFGEQKMEFDKGEIESILSHIKDTLENFEEDDPTGDKFRGEEIKIQIV